VVMRRTSARRHQPSALEDYTSTELKNSSPMTCTTHPHAQLMELFQPVLLRTGCGWPLYVT
jgi:hypothetical protein